MAGYRKVQLPVGEVEAGPFARRRLRAARPRLRPGGNPDLPRHGLRRAGAHPRRWPGPRLLLAPAWGGDLTQIRARALDNGVWVVTAGYDVPSAIIDPAGEIRAQTWKGRRRRHRRSSSVDLGAKVRRPWVGDWHSAVLKQRRIGRLRRPPGGGTMKHEAIDIGPRRRRGRCSRARRSPGRAARRPRCFSVLARPRTGAADHAAAARTSSTVAWAAGRRAPRALRGGAHRGGPRRAPEELREKAARASSAAPDRSGRRSTPRSSGRSTRDGYRIEKMIFESLPGFHVTALLYVPDGPVRTASPPSSWRAATPRSGKAYRGLPGDRRAPRPKRGYVVLCWDPVGQGERSQFWDAARGRSRYNLVCGEHAVLGNLATLAGTSLRPLHGLGRDARRRLPAETRPEVEPSAHRRSPAPAAAGSRRPGSAPSTSA